MDLDIHAPSTCQPPAYRRAKLASEAAKLGKRLDGRPLARGGYVCYLPRPEAHTNTAASYPGFGATPVRIVRADRAPKWALEQAVEHGS